MGIAVVVEPQLVVETVRLDDERISLPPSNGVPVESLLWRVLEKLPVRPDLPPPVILLEEHEDSAGNADDLERLGRRQDFGYAVGKTGQRRIIFFPRNNPVSLRPGASRRRDGRVESCLAPRGHGRPQFWIDETTLERGARSRGGRPHRPNPIQIVPDNRRGCVRLVRVTGLSI